MLELDVNKDHFDQNKIKLLNEFVEDSIQKEVFPGVEIMVFQDKSILFHQAFGSKQVRPETSPLRVNSIFDVASITKPMVTATLTMILLEQGKINLPDPVANYFTEFDTEEKNSVTIKHLLAHTSGLPDVYPLYKEANTIEVAIDKLLSLPLTYKPGEKVVYSCMGFILLKLILEKITGKSLDVLAQELIFNPLEMNESFFNPPKEVYSKIVPTGDCESRKRLLIGEVHDENCALFNGIGGNAGLFSTSHDIAIYSNMILGKGFWNGTRILTSDSVDLMLENQNKHGLAPRGLGFHLKDKDHRPCGELFGKKSFGHTGFTGTSFWIDPETKVGIIILSNRVHFYYWKTTEINKSFRMRTHNLLLSALKI